MMTFFSLLDHRYEGFSKTYRIICDYVRNHYLDLSYLSITELSEKTDVSVGSITGFCKALGYQGYASFQKELQRMAQQEMFAMREIKNSIAGDSKGDLLRETIETNISNLQCTYSDHLAESFLEAVDTLCAARRIYVIGLRSAYAVAYYFYFTLSDFQQNVVLLTLGEGDVFDRIMHIAPDDVLVTIGFEKYTKATYDITRFFHDKGCRIIALTDRLSSPLASIAEITLIAQNSSTTFSYVSAMTILNAVIIGVGRRNKKRTLRELEARQSILKDCNVHY